ncbi:hypothetical protein SAY87_021084 [Trapa incisa]|uniref:Uncharacterized protein n=1 Tax=Trapa incisa TaxID=236973 RepID=A0AAN7JR99_9MYRT|nr:hypothetical protein SAY87_021084 [Trapa incisa]
MKSTETVGENSLPSPELRIPAIQTRFVKGKRFESRSLFVEEAVSLMLQMLSRVYQG